MQETPLVYGVAFPYDYILRISVLKSFKDRIIIAKTPLSFEYSLPMRILTESYRAISLDVNDSKGALSLGNIY